jgi:folate-binding protein YgfZ
MPNPRLFDRRIIRLSPNAPSVTDEPIEDVRAFLQGLVTQDMRSSLPVWAALLSPQGKVLFDFFMHDADVDILLDCEASQAELLVRRLSMYRLRRKITIAIDDDMAVFWNREPGENPDPRLVAIGDRWLAAPSLDDRPVDAEYLAHRLSLGVTEGVVELGSDQTLWLECNAAELNGVSFDKGCYVGQENTARMNWRQKVNRRMVVVPIAQADAKRQRAAYADLGVSVEHRRVEDLYGVKLPVWLIHALGSESEKA